MPTNVISNAQLKAYFDTARLETFLHRNRRAFRDLSRDAVRYGAVQVALKASTSTKIAPKKRRIVKNPKRAGNKFSTKNENPYLWYAVKPKKPHDIYLPIWSGSKLGARHDRKAKITRRGLAKNAWKWMIASIDKSRGVHNPVRWRSGDKNRYQKVHNRSKSKNPSIHMFDKLDYASLAFHVKGRSPIMTVMERAENAMINRLKGRVRGATASRSGLHRG